MPAKFNTRPMPRFAKQSGLAIVDAVLWLVIFAAILAAIFGIRNIAWPKAQGWLEASAVQTSMQQINSMFTGSPNFAALTTASVASSSFFADKYLPGGGVITNRFGGTVTIGVASNVSPSDMQSYSESNVPSNACIGLVNQMIDDADRITVAGTIVKPINGLISPTTLTTQCNSAETVTIMFEKIQQH